MSVRNNLPECPSAPIVSTSSDVRIYEIKLITPLFGGGVSTRVNDSSFPIRPTSIRGQLQFWWRATVGAQYETKEDLRKAQSAIWGDTARASRVQIRVDYVQADEPRPCARFDPDHKNPGKFRSMPTWNDPFHNSALSYALFPFQGQLANRRQHIEVAPASCIHNATFRLSVKCDPCIDFVKQVEPAIWAWVNFGGLGSRTRRGCGALFCKSFAPNDAKELNAAWQRFMPDLFPQREWPTMASAILAGARVANSHEAWDQVIEKIKTFRQGNDFARDRGSPPSRSRFPEPDTIRRITDSWKQGHEPRGTKVIPDGFPRAEFGLPIVFHFKDAKKNATDPLPHEPFPTILLPFFAEKSDLGPKQGSDGCIVGETKDRMASPLILKPLQLTSLHAIPIILRLNVELPQRVELQDSQTHECLTRRRAVPVRHPDFASGSSPINGRSSNGSAVEAFLKYADENGFTEISR